MSKLDIVFGQTSKRIIAAQVISFLRGIELEGTLYIGYPVLSSVEEKIEVDALLVTKEIGLVGFLFALNTPHKEQVEDWRNIGDAQSRLYFALKNSLSRHGALRKGRDLAFPVQAITIFPDHPNPSDEIEGLYCSIEELANCFKNLEPIPDSIFRPLQAALQRVTNIKPHKKRSNVVQTSSKGAVLQQIENEIANLDQWQKWAAIESPEGPQRIRGLAGSGKTIVLALKAAYLHTQYPDWKIAVTFQTRSLYQQFKDLIRRFCFEHLNDEPNWENLRIMHAWGANDRLGMYAEMAQHLGLPPQSFLSAKTRFGMQNAFKGVCAELLSVSNVSAVRPLYDAVLIDEAQDLPPSFFQLIYRFTKPPKRIVWAYDELQLLSEVSMPTTNQLFGESEAGKPNVELRNEAEQPRQDIILPVCYRNTPWALTMAHALGFGIYREGRLVQHFDEPELWEEIGYKVSKGTLRLDQKVVLERASNSYPHYFKELIRSDDAIISKIFKDEFEQAEWIAKEIKKNIESDELDPDDILVIMPNAYKAKPRSAILMDYLARHGVQAHLAGVTSSLDELFVKQSVALAHIFRSKGNEAPMVYVVDCQDCFSGHELITIRNILFTAITRSRAWIRLTGYGSDMEKIQEEIDKVWQHDFSLDFRIPSDKELMEMRKINRDRTNDEKLRIKKAEQGLKEFLSLVEKGELALENLPADLRSSLAILLKQEKRITFDDGE